MDFVARLIAVLDGLPDSGRGLLSALLLVLLLMAFDGWVRGGSQLAPPAENDDSTRARWRRLRLSFKGYRWRIAHVKTSLLALLLVPLLSSVLAGVRIPVFVEALPGALPLNPWWLQGPLLVWLLVALALFGQRLWQWSARPASLWRCATAMPNTGKLRPAEPAPAAMVKRAEHWQRRLGLNQAIALRLGDVAAPMALFDGGRVIELPRAAAHWPAAATDVALIKQLCHFALGHHHWLRFATLVGCLYWPLRYVRELLPSRLEQDFQAAAGELAAACYRDPLGYRRAAKALAERLDTGPVVPVQPPQADPEDPYGRVFSVFVQVVLVVYVLTGTTLREIPDDSNFRYAEFVDDWYESFQRSVKYAPESIDNPASRPAPKSLRGAPSAPPAPAPGP